MTASWGAGLLRRIVGRRLLDESGQSLLEGGLLIPLLLLVALGMYKVGAALRDQHTVARLAREGSNLISRDVTLQAAATALAAMDGGPVDLDAGGKVIFSVIKRGATVGTPNYNRLVLYQRHTYGSHPGTSRLGIAGSGSFGVAPKFIAANSDTNTGLRVTNAPAGVATTVGALIYVTEVYTTHPIVASLSMFGITLPTDLYSIAYF